jgi:hypothetical protein
LRDTRNSQILGHCDARESQHRSRRATRIARDAHGCRDGMRRRFNHPRSAFLATLTSPEYEQPAKAEYGRQYRISKEAISGR